MLESCALTTDSLGLSPADRFGIVQLAETRAELALLPEWFDDQWQALASGEAGASPIHGLFAPFAFRRSASEVYPRTLDAFFADMSEGADEKSIVKSSTGVRNTVI